MQLLRGEQIIFAGRPSPRASLGFFLRWGAVSMLPALIATYLWAHNDPTWLSLTDWWGISLLLVALVFVRNATYRRSLRFTVTNQRILIARGVLARTERTTAISRIQNVTIRQSLLQRMLGIGDVEFDTVGGDLTDSDFRFIGIAHPRQVAQRIEYDAHGQPSDLWDARL